MNKLVLTKSSSESEIKLYFQKVLELKQSNDNFPINLDDVWMLVYADKGKAVRALKKEFIESEDFVIFAQNGKNSKIGRSSDVYKLSISCLEYFIARKVRPIFEVYRQVFHKVTEQRTLSQLEILAQSTQVLLEQEKRLSLVENRVKEIEAKSATRPDYYTIVGYATRNGMSINLKQASTLGRKASELCKRQGLLTDECPDPRFGRVKMYPIAVLKTVFDAPINQC